jgi:hypothetical protein
VALGLILRSVVGFSTGLIQENLSYPLPVRWNAMDEWIWGLVAAIPSAAAAPVAFIEMRRNAITGGIDSVS